MINRAQLRGRPLDDNCKWACRAPQQYGLNDDRVFCYGLQNYTNDEYLDKCKTCGAFVYNAESEEEPRE